MKVVEKILLKYGPREYDYSKPEEEVVKISNYFKENGIKKVLDLGCGKGRHFLFLLENGFDAYGIDINAKAISKARALSQCEDRLFVADMVRLPFKDAFFEGIISNQVIYHATKERMRKAISEMYRVLKGKGLFFITLQGRDGQEWRMGRKLEEWTYVASAGPDKGIPHHFVDEKEIEELFGKENLIKVYRDDRNDFWVLGRKN